MKSPIKRRLRVRVSAAVVFSFLLAVTLIGLSDGVAYFVVNGWFKATGVSLRLDAVVYHMQVTVPAVSLVVTVGAVALFLSGLLVPVVLRERRVSVRRVGVSVGLVVLLLVGLNLTVVPVVRATIASTGYYYLDTPLPLADWYVGEYTNTTYFAINGSNWDNYQLNNNASHLIRNAVLGNVSAGDTIKFLGNFNLDTQLFIGTAGLTLDCVGATFTSTENITACRIETNDITIRGGNWVGNTVGVTNSDNIGIKCYGSGTYNVRVENANFSNYYYCTEWRANTYNLVVDHCSFFSPVGKSDGGCALYAKYAYDSAFTNNLVALGGVSGNGVNVDVGHGIRITGNDFSGWSDTPNHAIYLSSLSEGGTDSNYGHIIANNVFHDPMGGLAVLVKCSSNTIIGNVFENFTGTGITGIQISPQPSGNACRNTIIGNTFRNMQSWSGAILIGHNTGSTDACDQNIVTGNTFENVASSTGAAIHLYSSLGKYMNYTKIVDNMFYDCNQGVDVGTDAGGVLIAHTEISGNTFRDVATPVADAGLSTLIRWNTGYKTEASGSLVSCENGTAIAHGMVTTPAVTSLCLHGPSAYNATFVYRVPTILEVNVTHIVIEFLAWETAGWTQVPVTAVEAATVWWTATTWDPP